MSKSSGYVECREAVEKCLRKEPLVCEPFVVLFDTDGLYEVRDRFGYDLYREVLIDFWKERGMG